MQSPLHRQTHLCVPSTDVQDDWIHSTGHCPSHLDVADTVVDGKDWDPPHLRKHPRYYRTGDKGPSHARTLHRRESCGCIKLSCKLVLSKVMPVSDTSLVANRYVVH